MVGPSRSGTVRCRTAAGWPRTRTSPSAGAPRNRSPTWRATTRSPICPIACCCASDWRMRSESCRGAGDWRCSISISIISRASTIPWAIRSATSCSGRWPTACAIASVTAIRWHASAATSSPSSKSASNGRPTPRCWRGTSATPFEAPTIWTAMPSWSTPASGLRSRRTMAPSRTSSSRTPTWRSIGPRPTDAAPTAFSSPRWTPA